MIQRIQTLYLLLAAGASFSQLTLPYMSVPADNPAHNLKVFEDGMLNPFDNIGLLGLCVLSGLVALAAIFIFKNRPLQARLAGGAQIATLLLLVLLGVSIYQAIDKMPESGTYSFQIGIAFPVLSLILLWMASRGIRADEKLVRSSDRLR
ncbi:MAG: DUF4293 domain-containing protein [Chitinophagales bacterium]|nr:DUF4293 domain-containing protein [Chitinophagales bacterium]